MGRFIAPGALPPDRAFAARSVNDSEGRAADAKAYADAALDDVMGATNVQKVVYYEAKAQQLANDNQCAVMVHWRTIPHFQNMPPTMEADLIPSKEPFDA